MTDKSNAIYPGRADGMPYEAFTVSTRNSYFQLVATGATGGDSYVWSKTAGDLPPGLSLASDGKISGTPTTVGSYTFTARVASGAQTPVTKSLTMEVKAHRGQVIEDACFGVHIHWGMFVSPRLYGKSQIPAFESRAAVVNFTTWAQTIKALGFKSVTFSCIWQDSVRLWPSTTPTKFELKTIRNYAKEFRDACRAEGLLFGTYFCPDYQNSNRPGEGPATGQSYLDTPNPPDGSLDTYSWGGMNNGLINELVNDVKVDFIWTDMGGAPELYASSVDPNWFYIDTIMKIIRAGNPDCCLGINGGIRNGSTMPEGIPVRYPNTDFVISEGYPGGLALDVHDLGKPTIVDKKYAVTTDLLLGKHWAFSEATVSGGHKDPAGIIAVMKENKRRGVFTNLVVPVEAADGTLIHPFLANAIAQISEYMKSDFGYSGEVQISVADGLTMLTGPAGSRIFYSTDGSEVDTTSKVYVRPIPLPTNSVVKARALQATLPIGRQRERRVTELASVVGSKTLINSSIPSETYRNDLVGYYRGMRVVIGAAPIILRKVGRKGTATLPKRFLIRRQYDNYPIYWGTLQPTDEVVGGYQYIKVPNIKLDKGVAYRIFFKEDASDNYASSTFATIPSFDDLRVTKPAQASVLGETTPIVADAYGQFINLIYDTVEGERSRDLALGKPCKFRTLAGGSLGPSSTAFEENAVDGVYESNAKAGGSYAYETLVDLLSIYEIGEIQMRFAMSGFATSFEIWLSLDDTPQTMRKVVAKSNNTTKNFDFKFDPIPARYIHVKSLTPNGPGQLGLQAAINILSAFEQL